MTRILREAEELTDGTGIQLVPRMKQQGYERPLVDKRRRWVEEKTGCALTHVGTFSIPPEAMRGNIENPIGTAQVPLGVAGPLLVHGEHARGTFYVPLATTEGALVRSYERGMVTLTRSGGVTTRVYSDENRLCPVFFFRNVSEAHDFARQLPRDVENLRAEAESTTRHGKLLGIECHAVGREVIVNFRYSTGDAHGMNLILKATEKACQWIMRNSLAQRYLVFSGLESEKHASGFLFPGGKGKKVVAGAQLPAAVARAYLHTTPGQLLEVWHQTMLGHTQAAALGYNGHYANGLTALLIACGQDVANVVNAAVGITNLEVLPDGDLYASVTLPSLTVATVGGGTALGTAAECLAMLGCAGSGKALKFAEIVAATVLAGELSMGAAVASGEMTLAHESYGRNRPAGHEDGIR
jgi:hydroxymethylglutaryl-CoA reductase (NADPH)